MADQCSSVRAELGMAEFFSDTWKMYYLNVDLNDSATCNITSLFVRAYDQDDTTSSFVEVSVLLRFLPPHALPWPPSSQHMIAP